MARIKKIVLWMIAETYLVGILLFLFGPDYEVLI